MGGQISWLLPAALIVLVTGLVATLRHPRTDRTRAALLLWGGWLVVTGVVFSFMSGVIHPYYTNMLAPPIAVLVGVGAVELARRRESLARARRARRDSDGDRELVVPAARTDAVVASGAP